MLYSRPFYTIGISSLEIRSVARQPDCCRLTQNVMAAAVASTLQQSSEIYHYEVQAIIVVLICLLMACRIMDPIIAAGTSTVALAYLGNEIMTIDVDDSAFSQLSSTFGSFVREIQRHWISKCLARVHMETGD